MRHIHIGDLTMFRTILALAVTTIIVAGCGGSPKPAPGSVGACTPADCAACPKMADGSCPKLSGGTCDKSAGGACSKQGKTGCAKTSDAKTLSGCCKKKS
jgi:hypothetical protein|tara:strand:+ start:1052 stop:1351 length:300 start_codon:yes stop_codon:yes gene_type:complete